MRRIGFVSLGTLTLAGAVNAQTTEIQVPDPIQPVNRAVFGFNKQILDRFILTPLIKLHNRAIPRPARISIRHFFQNLHEPITAENNLLQGHPVRAGNDAGRFVVNSTVGLVGLMDVAADIGLPRHDEDFGQTLGRYGVGSGPYLVLPVIGSSSVRDLSGRVVDGFIDPLGFINFQNQTAVSAGKSAATIFVERAHKVKHERRVQEANADYYASEREHYIHRRENEIHNRQTGDEPVEAAATSAQTTASAEASRPATTEPMSALRTDLAHLDLSVQSMEIRDGDLHIEVAPKNAQQVLPCDRIWRSAALEALTGATSVTIVNMDGNERFVCSKFLPGTAEPPPAAPDHHLAPSKEGVPMTMNLIPWNDAGAEIR